MKTKGFTLLELVVVIVIIGIISGISVVSYTNTRERSLEKEALASLRLIKAAERQFYARMNRFWPITALGSFVDSINDINGNLSLNLQETYWNYSVWGTPGGTGYTGAAQRAGRTWSINNTNNSVCVGTCL